MNTPPDVTPPSTDALEAQLYFRLDTPHGPLSVEVYPGAVHLASAPAAEVISTTLPFVLDEAEYTVFAECIPFESLWRAIRLIVRDQRGDRVSGAALEKVEGVLLGVAQELLTPQRRHAALLLQITEEYASALKRFRKAEQDLEDARRTLERRREALRLALEPQPSAQQEPEC